MISLSKEWALLSKAMYGEKYIDELADFLRNNKVHSVLECGCGNGDVIRGLAERGFRGVGIDNDKEMILMAKRENPHQNIKYQLMD